MNNKSSIKDDTYLNNPRLFPQLGKYSFEKFAIEKLAYAKNDEVKATSLPLITETLEPEIVAIIGSHPSRSNLLVLDDMATEPLIVHSHQ